MQRRNVLASLALVGLLYGLSALRFGAWFWFAIVSSALFAVFARLTYFGLIHFTGSGFTQEFFIHFEWQSFLIAVEEYGLLLAAAFVMTISLAFLGWLTREQMPRLSLGKSVTLVVVCTTALLLLRAVMPEWQLFRSWQAWSTPVVTGLDPDLASSFEELGLVETDLIGKNRLRADPKGQPKNLILLYLESVGVNLIGREDWPELMPNLADLIDEHALLEHIWTSSYITIEGITNSQCGTLFPFVRGSDTMAEGDGIASDLPCLGDVLDAAGYHQVYMGGAGMSFAGKGSFLAAHGYDELKGLEHWQQQGLAQRPGKWGLSDPELFDLSIQELQRLRTLGQPFNLTMLTIGTHLPGYSYRECTPYSASESAFLSALHCTDQLLGRWLKRLREEGLLDDTVLVITADHHIFPNPAMRELFGNSVMDRRLPLIVLGEDLPEPVHRVGAGYDLAPTILDLLGVSHNARFVLGRSLLRESSRPNYFVKRYADVHEGSVLDNGELDCRDDWLSRPSLPLDACSKRNLLDLLGAIKAELSSDPASVQCEQGGERNHVEIVLHDRASLRAFVGGESQSDRFIYQSRRVESDGPGQYVMAFSEDGELLSRRFVPALEESELASVIGQVQGDIFVVARQVGESLEVLPSIDVLNHEGRLLQTSGVLNEDLGVIRLDFSDLFCIEGEQSEGA
jgi:hypothetical protein